MEVVQDSGSEGAIRKLSCENDQRQQAEGCIPPHESVWRRWVRNKLRISTRMFCSCFHQVYLYSIVLQWMRPMKWKSIKDKTSSGSSNRGNMHRPFSMMRYQSKYWSNTWEIVVGNSECGEFHHLPTKCHIAYHGHTIYYCVSILPLCRESSHPDVKDKPH